MSDAFVWFHNNSRRPNDSATFYEALLGWKRAEGPAGMTMLAGDRGPFAAVGDEDGVVGWIPYAQVEDVDAATSKATNLGATVIRNKTRGPAGEFTIVRDPGGAAIARATSGMPSTPTTILTCTLYAGRCSRTWVASRRRARACTRHSVFPATARRRRRSRSRSRDSSNPRCERRRGMEAEKLFWDLAAELQSEDPRVVEGTIMNGRCLRVAKEFLALVDYQGSGLVVKLPRARVAELIRGGQGQPFAPAGQGLQGVVVRAQARPDSLAGAPSRGHRPRRRLTSGRRAQPESASAGVSRPSS
jgi:predicted enzyme related to lactoylglutathione lyase